MVSGTLEETMDEGWGKVLQSVCPRPGGVMREEEIENVENSNT